jgi:hypothetical protein
MPLRDRGFLEGYGIVACCLKPLISPHEDTLTSEMLRFLYDFGAPNDLTDI